MLCFDFVNHGKHNCMPVCADFELYEACTLRYGKAPRYNFNPGADNTACNEWTDRKKQLEKSMRVLIDRVEKVLPVEALQGIIRWGKALGML
jgi:hypothetical protein